MLVDAMRVVAEMWDTARYNLWARRRDELRERGLERDCQTLQDRFRVLQAGSRAFVTQQWRAQERSKRLTAGRPTKDTHLRLIRRYPTCLD